MKIFLSVLFLLISSLTALEVKSRFNYYTSEKFAELIINEKDTDLAGYRIQWQSDEIKPTNQILESSDVQTISVFIEDWQIGKKMLQGSLISASDTLHFHTEITKLKPTLNEVKIDRYHQSLIVDDLPFIPFGFYCYWPVQPTLAEEEVVKGFNMMSPYQKVEAKTSKERRQYMDRCAELGLKVNYNLCSLGGGGGVGSDRLKRSHAEIIKLLKEEIKEFKDHPALLSWYISDEPALNGVKPDLLQDTYNTIKAIDPYHPVSIVFMHSSKAEKYRDAMDIVMADPYPIPQHSVTQVQSVTRRLHKQFYLDKPVWIVPQAFGGNEWWPREPTDQEIRVMTYLAIIEQATGVQYFIRNGLNSFPKATYTWGECGKIAHEIAELTPFLTDFDKVEPIPIDAENVSAKHWKLGKRDLIIVVNSENEPSEFALPMPNSSKSAYLPFENREENSKDGTLNSWIDALGTRVYILSEEKSNSTFIHPENIALDPSFEFNPSVGVPSNCYAKIRGDKGASYFIDSRTAFDGNHSIRLTCPTEMNGVVLKFYRQRLQKNKTYTLSVWAKAQQEKRIERKGFWNWLKRLFSSEEKWNTLKIHLYNVEKEFKLSENWQQYSIRTNILATNTKSYLASPQIQMTGKGVCWIDGLELIPDLQMEETLYINAKHIAIDLKSNHDPSQIFFSFDNGKQWLSYEKPLKLTESTLLGVKNMHQKKEIGRLQKNIYFHQAVGADVTYHTAYTKKYNGGGKKGLVNAKFANKYFKNRNWQGFIAQHANFDLDLGEVKSFHSIRIGALHDIHSWIFLPEKITIFQSEDGNNYQKLTEISNSMPQQNPDRFVKRFEIEFEPVKTRFLKIVVTSLKQCPDWHKGAGGACWLFLDEVEIE